MDELQTLLASPFHEHRLIALIILVAQHKRASADRKAELHQFYLGHLSGVNNWDLVDGSAPALVGEHLTGSVASKEKQLRTLIRSKNVWHRRIAVLATFTELRAGRSALTFAIAEELLSDKHELVHKSVGWMLREAGKLSQPDLLSFLRLHYDRLPRTTLRYAIELLEPVDRKLWLREPQ